MATLLLVITHPVMLIIFGSVTESLHMRWLKHLTQVLTFQGNETCCISKFISFFACFFVFSEVRSYSWLVQRFCCLSQFGLPVRDLHDVYSNPLGGGWVAWHNIMHNTLEIIKVERWKLCSAPVKVFHFCSDEPTICRKQHSTKSFQINYKRVKVRSLVN